MKESDLLRACRLALPGPDSVFWRNSVGYDAQARQPYGLAVGSSDLIGCVAGKFVALELKSDTGRLTEEQKRFLRLVQAKGGIAAEIRSVEQALAVLAEARK